MKTKLFYLLTMVLFLSSCNLVMDYTPIPIYKIDPPDLKKQIDHLNSISAGRLEYFLVVTEWVISNIKHISDPEKHGIRDYWQTPAETYADLSGDCEDRAIIWAYFMDRYYYDNSNLRVCLLYNQNTKSYHMCGTFEEYWFNRISEEYEPVKYYSLEEALKLAEYYR